MSESREDEAVSAYFKLLKSKGADMKSIGQREMFFVKLIPQLVSKEGSGQVYRDEIETLMDEFPPESWPANLAIAREFYPFWLGDIKAIGHLAAEQGFDLHPVGWMPDSIVLKDLWENIDQEKFETAASWALKSYTSALKGEATSSDIVDTRVKFAKLLLVRLREAPVTQKNAYRIAVDATLPLFELKKTRQLFLVVIREFYYFWSGNPDAHEHVMKANKVSML